MQGRKLAKLCAPIETAPRQIRFISFGETHIYPAHDLYKDVVPPADQTAGGVASGIVLIQSLTGFMDAGGRHLAVSHMSITLENH